MLKDKWYLYILFCHVISTYDHREWRTGLPVRSAVLKPLAGWLVVGWVTTSESQLLYVFFYAVFLLYFNGLVERGVAVGVVLHADATELVDLEILLH